MLSPSPYGSQKKGNFAASVWSFDSGYGTQDTLDERIGNPNARAFYLHAGLSANSLQGRLESCENLQLAGEHQVAFHATSHPDFASASNYGNSDSAQETSNGADGCWNCGPLSFTNPTDRNVCCEVCRVAATVQPSKLLLDDFTEARPIHSGASAAAYHGRRAPEQRPVPARCSACELSALIDPSTPFSCPSCAPIPCQPPSLPQEEDHKVRRSQARRHHKLPLSALTRLQAWLDAHQDDPYPSASEKKQLAQQCGITEKQVTTWFTNARARQLSPLDTYLSSASEEEGASEADIASAALTPPYISDTTGFTYLSDTTRTPAASHRKAASVSGSSAFSTTQAPFLPSKSRRGKKKNYRRHLTSSNTSTNTRSPQLNSYLHSPIEPVTDAPSSTEQELWQCTFCRRALVPKSWRRHEETQHRPRAQWTCMLDGPRLTMTSQAGTNVPSTETSYCAFCMAPNPSDEHFRDHHRVRECERRPLEERTFFRPDHLRQHVRNFHSATLFELAQMRWKSGGSGGGGNGKGKEKGQEEVWICGFCGARLESWTVRETHIAGHFKEGRRMGEWREWPASSSLDEGDNKLKRSETVKLSRRSSIWNPLKRVGTRKVKGEEADNEQEEEEDHGSFGAGFARRLSRTLTRRSTRRSRKSHDAVVPAAGNEHVKQEEEVQDPGFTIDFDGLALSGPGAHMTAAPIPMSMSMSNMSGINYGMYQDCNNAHAPISMLPDINMDPLMSNPSHSHISFMDIDIDWSQMGGFEETQMAQTQMPQTQMPQPQSQLTSDPPVPGALCNPPPLTDVNGNLLGGSAGNGTWDPNTGVQYASSSYIPGSSVQGGAWGGMH